MKYAVVSTTSFLLLVNLETREVAPIENHRTEYYGITWFPGDQSLILSHSGIDNNDLVDVASYAGSEAGWISRGAVSSKAFLSAPHQIVSAPDGRIVCTNTGRNVITVIDLERPGVFQETGIGPARWDRLSLLDRPGEHLNSLYLEGETLHVLAHGHEKGSCIARYTYPELRLIKIEELTGRAGLHNLWITSEGQRLSCNSEAGALIDLDEEEPLWESGSSVYTRGLAACTDYVVIGESEKSNRSDRRRSIGGLWILDRKSWKAQDYIFLGPFGAVHDVRILDVPDEAHNSSSFSGIDSLKSINLKTRTADSKLAGADAILTSKKLWSEFGMLFGSPEPTADGFRRASRTELCIALKKNSSSDQGLLFEYSLDPAPGFAHASAILGYHGRGSDTHMAAIMLAAVSDTAASLSIWRHDGQLWSKLPELHSDLHPLTGRFEMLSSKGNVTVLIDDEQVLRMSLEKLCAECQNEVARCGMRWIGAAVKPVTRASV